jgi:hypothetical protein
MAVCRKCGLKLAEQSDQYPYAWKDPETGELACRSAHAENPIVFEEGQEVVTNHKELSAWSPWYVVRVGAGKLVAMAAAYDGGPKSLGLFLPAPKVDDEES